MVGLGKKTRLPGVPRRLHLREWNLLPPAALDLEHHRSVKVLLADVLAVDFHRQPICALEFRDSSEVEGDLCVPPEPERAVPVGPLCRPKRYPEVPRAAS